MTTATIEKSAAKIVPPAEWLAARKQLLAKEKEFTRLRDDLSRQRREMPWEKVEKKYVFEGVHGKETFADMFDGRSQLIVYHFMLGPGWKEGCPSCSYLADSFDAARVHLAQRDTTFAVDLAGDIAGNRNLQEAYGMAIQVGVFLRKRFQLRLSRFFHQRRSGQREDELQLQLAGFRSEEGPGASVFYKQGNEIFHTYSAYARGLDILLPTYNFLDMTAKGRDEDALPFPMAWVRHHDRYGNPKVMDAITVLAGKPCCSEESK